MGVTTREVNAIELTVPQLLRWSESAVYCDRSDHLDHMPHPGRSPLVVDPLFRGVRLTMVLMDGGSRLNILYVKTLDDMKIPRSEVKPTSAPFHEVVPGNQIKPLESS